MILLRFFSNIGLGPSAQTALQGGCVLWYITGQEAFHLKIAVGAVLETVPDEENLRPLAQMEARSHQKDIAAEKQISVLAL